MNVLFCSIIRDRLSCLATWHKQLCELIALRSNDTCKINCYENDSTDGSADFLKKALWPCPSDIRCEILSTKSFGSVKSQERVDLLASARNRCMLELNDAYKIADKVMWVEVDQQWNPIEVSSLLDTDDDIVSGLAMICNRTLAYDTWGMTMNKMDESWIGSNSNVPKCKTKVHTTFGGVCVYKGSMIRAGIKFDWKNPYKPGQYGCDTSNICRLAQIADYHEIFVDPTCITEC